MIVDILDLEFGKIMMKGIGKISDIGKIKELTDKLEGILKRDKKLIANTFIGCPNHEH